MECKIYNYQRGRSLLLHGTQLKENVLFFVGGLNNDLDGVPYVRSLAEALAKIGWSLIEIQTRSSYIGWGTGSIARDAEDIKLAIEYIAKNTGELAKVAIMGFSTGCQDVMYYLTQQYEGDKNLLTDRPKVDFAIIQAPVSDRECYVKLNGKETWKKWLDYAEGLVDAGKGDDIMPTDVTNTFVPAPVSATRWVSLMKVKGGDDFYSSDLSVEDYKKTFGMVDTPLLVLYSNEDESVPQSVDKQGLVDKWQSIAPKQYWSPMSAVIPGTHAIDPATHPEGVKLLIEKVTKLVSS